MASKVIKKAESRKLYKLKMPKAESFQTQKTERRKRRKLQILPKSFGKPKVLSYFHSPNYNILDRISLVTMFYREVATKLKIKA